MHEEVMMKKFFGIVSVLALALILGVGSASADTIYTIDNNGGGGLSCCTGPYATVDVHLVNSTTATVTFDALVNGGYQYLLAGTSAVDVNVNATSWTISGLSGTQALSGFLSTNADLTSGGSGNVSSFGVFNQTVNNFDGFQHSWTSVSFTLTNTSGAWVDSGSVLTNNGSGFAVAMHGFACATPCTIDTGAFTTGFATTGGAVNTPEPGSVLLLGSGLSAFGLWGRRKQVFA